MNERILNVSFNKNYNYLIVHQITDNNKDVYKKFVESLCSFSNIEYVQSFDIGLSKSRNLALDISKGKHVWIMDDDTIILNGVYEKISQHIEKYDFLSIDFLSNENEVKTVRECNLNLFNSASVSSIQMILSRKIVESKIRFNENFGLGTLQPSGEEYIFTSEVLKYGFNGIQLDFAGCIHPDITSGQDFYSTPMLLKTKFMMFEQIFGRYGMILSLAFIIKKSFTLLKKGRFLNSLYQFKYTYFK